MAKTTFTGPIVAGSNGTEGEIRITDGKNVNEQKYIAIKAPATITADTTLTFPNGAGSAGQILSTDGNGTLSWVNDSAGNPAGTNGQVQTNDGGVFGAIPDGTAGQILTSNGAGVAPSFQAAPSGGIAAVVDDTTPQLGGNLDLNTFTINGTGNLDISNGTIKLEGNYPDGSNNVVLGADAGAALAGGSASNTLIGSRAGIAISSGLNNVAIGRNALDAATTSSGNVAVGNSAGGNATGGDNTFIGGGAGSATTSGTNQTIIGNNAEASSPTASNEITIGDLNTTSLRIPGLTNGVVSGTVLTYNGVDIQPVLPSPGIDVFDPAWTNTGDTIFLQSNGVGNTETYTTNVVVNSGSIKLDGNHPTGINNVALGNAAGGNLSSGAEDNTLIGKDAGALCQNNDRSTVVGADALKNCISGQNNTAIGKSALQNATSNDNTAIGREAGSNLTNGTNCTFIGQFAQPSSASANNEVTIGNTSVTSLRIPGLQGGASSGDVLTFNGTDITLATPSGGAATDVDVNGGRVNLRGDLTTLLVPSTANSQLMGSNALSNSTSAASTVAIGTNALNGASSGQESNDNVAIGSYAMQNYIGNFAGPPNQQGHGNVAIGTSAGDAISGNNNIAIGLNTGTTISGFNNTAVGQNAMFNFPNTSGENNSCIGSNAQTSSPTVNNEFTLGDSAIATLRCQVTSITALSDARDKKDVEDANIGLDFINDLRPVKFVWDTRDGKKKDIKEVGFIAQELDEVQQKHGVEDHLQLVLKNNPDKLEASPGKLIPILVQAIKDLKKEIDELKKA